MQNAIKRQIKLLSDRVIKRTQQRQEKAQEYAVKFTRRTTVAAGKTVHSITYPHKHFDPIYCRRNANFLAKTIWHKIQLGTYEPIPAVRFEIPKFGGGKRQIMQFSIPDSAVAGVLNRRFDLEELRETIGQLIRV